MNVLRYKTFALRPRLQVAYSYFLTFLPAYLLYGVRQKNPTYGFLTFFPKRLGIFNQFLHNYYMTLYTLDDKFLFNYFQL